MKNTKNINTLVGVAKLSFLSFFMMAPLVKAQDLQTYEYIIKDYPLGVDCHQYALELEDRFKRVTQVDQVVARCTDIGETLSFVIEKNPMRLKCLSKQQVLNT